MLVLVLGSLARPARASGDAGHHARNVCLFVLGSYSLPRARRALGNTLQICVCSCPCRALARSLAPRLGDAGQHARNCCLFVMGSRSLARSPPIGAGPRWSTRSQLVSLRARVGLSLARSLRKGAGRRWATRSQLFHVRVGLSLARSVAPMGAGQRWGTRSQCLPVRPGLSLTPSHSRALGLAMLGRWATRSQILYVRDGLSHARSLAPMGAGRRWASRSQFLFVRARVGVSLARSLRKGAGRRQATRSQLL
jgi:hypothetical protein